MKRVHSCKRGLPVFQHLTIVRSVKRQVPRANAFCFILRLACAFIGTNALGNVCQSFNQNYDRTTDVRGIFISTNFRPACSFRGEFDAVVFRAVVSQYFALFLLPALLHNVLALFLVQIRLWVWLSSSPGRDGETMYPYNMMQWYELFLHWSFSFNGSLSVSYRQRLCHLSSSMWTCGVQPYHANRVKQTV